MAIELNVSLDRANLARFRRLLQANKLVAAQSLTFTAERAQAAWRVGNGLFHQRRDWINKGVRITHATPANLVAKVGTIDRYMGRHVKGIDEPKAAQGKGLFVPIQPITQQPTHTAIRAALRRARASKTAPFWRHGVLLRRTRRGHGSPLKVLAVLRRSVDIKPRLDALAIVDRTVQTEFPPVYERLLLKLVAKM